MLSSAVTCSQVTYCCFRWVRDVHALVDRMVYTFFFRSWLHDKQSNTWGRQELDRADTMAARRLLAEEEATITWARCGFQRLELFFIRAMQRTRMFFWILLCHVDHIHQHWSDFMNKVAFWAFLMFMCLLSIYCLWHQFCLYVCCLVDIVDATQQVLVEPFDEQHQSQLLLALLKRLIFRPFFGKSLALRIASNGQQCFLLVAARLLGFPK